MLAGYCWLQASGQASNIENICRKVPLTCPFWDNHDTTPGDVSYQHTHCLIFIAYVYVKMALNRNLYSNVDHFVSSIMQWK